jgi:hypothetical protein
LAVRNSVHCSFYVRLISHLPPFSSLPPLPGGVGMRTEISIPLTRTSSSPCLYSEGVLRTGAHCPHTCSQLNPPVPNQNQYGARVREWAVVMYSLTHSLTHSLGTRKFVSMSCLSSLSRLLQQIPHSLISPIWDMNG